MKTSPRNEAFSRGQDPEETLERLTHADANLVPFGRIEMLIMNDEWVIGALREIKALGGIGHLQDIRFGARGTTKRRALGGFDVQRIADELVARDFLRKSGKKDTYFITDAGRRFLDEHQRATDTT